jgi:hypothetical protein
METLKIIIIIAYFSANTIIAYEYFDKHERYRLLKFIAMYFFGLPYFVFMVLKILIWLFWNDFFQIPFFYKFYFTKEFKVVNPEHIPQFEKWKSKRGNSLKDMIYKYACELLINRAKKQL